jgi:hypothetical protein
MSIWPNRWIADLKKTQKVTKIQNVREIPQLVGMLFEAVRFQ